MSERRAGWLGWLAGRPTGARRGRSGPAERKQQLRPISPSISLPLSQRAGCLCALAGHLLVPACEPSQPASQLGLI